MAKHFDYALFVQFTSDFFDNALEKYTNILYLSPINSNI